MESAHCKTYQEVLAFFGTDPEKGLTEDQVKKNQAKYGLNELPAEEGMHFWFHFVRFNFLFKFLSG